MMKTKKATKPTKTTKPAVKENVETKVFRQGDIIAFLEPNRFRLDKVETRSNGEQVAEMTMVMDHNGKTCYYPQLGGPVSLKNVFLVSTKEAAPDRMDELEKKIKKMESQILLLTQALCRESRLNLALQSLPKHKPKI